jgi:hypothetical protein
MHRARPSTRHGALRRNPRSRLKLRDRLRPRSSQRDPPGHRYGSPKCSRESRRSSSRPGEPPRFRLQRAFVWRGPAIRDRRGTGRQIISAQNEPECIFAVAFTLIGGLSSATLTRTLKHVTFDDFLFPGSTMSRVPPSRRKRGLFIPSSGMLTSPPSRTSLMSRSCKDFFPWHDARSAGGSQRFCCPDSGADRRCA